MENRIHIIRRKTIGLAVAALMIVGTAVAIPSIASASHQRGAVSHAAAFSCSGENDINFSGTTGAVSISTSDPNCSMGIKGQWAKGSYVEPQVMNATLTVTKGKISGTLTSAEFKGTETGVLTSAAGKGFTGHLSETIVIFIDCCFTVGVIIYGRSAA
jgi:hypothetical protein